jgi:hypothetical protein
MINNYGAFSELPKPKGNDYGAFRELEKSSVQKKAKSRSNASDVSRMNPVYKPKASPGPIGSLRSVERSTPKPTPRAAERGKPKTQVTPRAAERGTNKPTKKRVEGAFLELPKPKAKSVKQTKNRSRGD